MIIQEIEKKSIGEVLRGVLASNERTLFAVDASARLVGVFSEGDLLRLLWKGVDLESSASEYMNHNPKYILEASENKEKEVLDLFRTHGVLLVPVVGTNRELIKVLSVRELI